ncbi:hypothetical protein NDU88_000006 [Pleurodeles waltl]|uniref:Uncharacterized protein n=1 Tax=Pleurodeles waltl TaxID=8319 RepID=A0AAV7UNS0_PLEWA|nr:hypothetical protein NDU88_000006 [Pleurodeles waltl]
MCAAQNSEERKKAAGAAQWWRATLDLRRTRRGAAHILLRGNSGSCSTSEAVWVKQVKLGALIQSVPGAEGGTEARADGRTVRQSGGDYDNPLPPQVLRVRKELVSCWLLKIIL